MLPTSFTQCIAAGLGLVIHSEPNAKLYEGLATAPGIGYVDHPSEFQLLDLTILAGDGTSRDIFMNTTDCAHFETSQSPGPWVGDHIIPWPVNMNADEADSLLKEAGYTDPYNSMLLRWPVYPGLDEPYYIFHLKGYKRRFVFVGTITGKVFPSN